MSTLQAPNKGLRFAVIGLGNIGLEHVKSLTDGLVKNASLSAVCARSLPDGFSLPDAVQYFQDYQTLLDEAGVDAVLVATPTMTHKEIGLAVLQSGRHLLMEKPLGMTVIEADELANYPLADGQLFGTVLNQRYDAVYSKIKSLLAENAIGQLQRLSWTLTHWYRPDVYYRVSSWRGTWKGEGGGLLLNQCIHNLDILQWLIGMPTQVWAQCQWGRYHDIEVEDEVSAFMQFENGATGIFISSTGEAPGVHQLDLVGDLGSVRYDGTSLTLHKLKQRVSEHSRNTTDMFSMPECEALSIDYGDQPNQHVGLIQDFVDAINDQTQLWTGAEEALKSVELADAILVSAWEGQTVQLPLDRKRFAAEFQKRLDQSQLRKKESLDVTIDLAKSFR